MVNPIKNAVWTPGKYAHELQPKPLNSREKAQKIAYLVFSILFFPLGLCRLAKRGITKLAGLAIYPAQLIIKKDECKKERRALKNEGYQSHYLKTPDNVRLHALYFAQPKPIEEQKTVILFAGNGSTAFCEGDVYKTFQKMGWNVLLFDPRHVGKSQKKLATCKSTVLDGETAYQFAKAQGVKKENILLWGHSLGGGIATAVAANHKKVMLVNDRSFSSLKTEINLLVGKGIGTVAAFFGWEYNSEENFKKVQGKKWVITAKDDEVIQKGARLGEKISKDQQTFLRTTHNTWYPAEVIERIVEKLGA